MIDLNHILLFIAVVSPLIVLVRIARLRNPRNHGWRSAALIVLAGCVVAWFLVPTIAGYSAGMLWCFLLLIPSLADRKIEELYLGRRFAEARRLAVVRQLLHPWKDSPYQPVLLRILEAARAGRLDRALDQLAIEREAATPAGRFAAALTFALTENWPGLVQWCRRDLSATANPAVLALYFRALGETGALDDLLLLLASRTDAREPRLTIDLPWLWNLALVLAFCGKTSALARLFEEDLRRAPPEERQFWLATAEWAERRNEAARESLERLRLQTHDALLRRSIERRLVHLLPGNPLSQTGERFLARVMADRSEARRAAPRRRMAATPAVWGLLLVNAAMFGVELLSGGSTSSLVLQNLGGLEPAVVIVRHEYWRLFTALFLHYGPLHLGINLLALYLLGPALERTIGATKFTLCYLLSGLGSGAGVVTLWWLGLTKSSLLVGASGSIMGVIGVSAGLLLRHRQSAFAGRQLQSIIAIVAIQTAFDLWSPQVSLAAHLGGFVSGLAIGVILSTKRSQRPPAPVPERA
ncbi:MAG: rhomboid family intramembrane serine protease [Chthoniobacterales bacterium]|nr:rhomboid family intramembrane serine protease [Chthoniobacterales bacterium]